MSNREAAIKIKLDNQEFVLKLGQIATESDKAGSKIGGSLSKGFEAGKGAVKDLFGSVKSLIGLGAVLGGSFSLKEGIQGALEMESRYRAIARTISKISGETISLAAVQKTVAEAGRNTMVSLDELTTGYQELLRTTGDTDFSKAALNAASQEATRTGKSFHDLSSIAGALNEKFGITGKGIDEALRMITANVDVGGPKLEEMAGGFDMLSATALSGGMGSAAGFKALLGILNETDNVLGGFTESNRALNGVFSALRAPEAFNKIKQQLAGEKGGADFVKNLINAPDAITRLNMILQKGGAVRKEFEKAITDRKEMALYKILTEPYDAAVKRAIAAGETGQHVIDEGASAFTEALNKMSNVGDSKADAEKELAARMASSKAKLDQAMKELQEAFAQPEVIKAVKDLMGLMPPLVKALSQLVQFFAAHPYIGAAGIVGGTAAKGAIGAAAPGLIAGAAKLAPGLFGKLGALITGGASSAAASIAGTASATGAAVAAPTSIGGMAVAGGTAAVAATVAAGTAAIAGIGASVYAAKQLMNASKSEGGVWNAVSGALSRGGELGGRALTPEEYDAKMAKNSKAVEKSTDVYEALNRNAAKASQALDRLARVQTPFSGGASEGVSKGPGGMTPAGPGWADKY